MSISYPIAELVPHSGTLSLLDQLIDYDDNQLIASVSIHSHSLFANEHGVPAWVGIEYMAQAIAAYAGTQAKLQQQAIRIGFLLGTRKYQCNCPYFPLGSELRITVSKEIQGDNGLGVFCCQISGEGIEASANLNVFQPNDVVDFLKHERVDS